MEEDSKIEEKLTRKATIANRQQQLVNSQVIKEDEIDLIELVRVVWSKRRFVLKVTGVFLTLGLVIAFTSPEEYETSSTLILEDARRDRSIEGSFGGLAALAGVDLGGLSSSSQAINPALYQSISKSTPFLLDLLKQEYYFLEVGKNLSIYDYYSNYFKISLFLKILSLPENLITLLKRENRKEEGSSLKEGTDALQLTKDQAGIIEDLKLRIEVEMDRDLNVIIISVEMQDPILAASIAQFTQDYITKYVTEYAISKSQQQLASLEKQYLERKSQFEQAQIRLASFRDRNQNVNTARAKSEEERLKSEYNLALDVYSQLAQQREAIKLQIQKNTPVFTVLEPVKIPVERSKPNRKLIAFLFLVLGFLTSISYLWGMKVINQVKKKLLF